VGLLELWWVNGEFASIDVCLAVSKQYTPLRLISWPWGKATQIWVWNLNAEPFCSSPFSYLQCQISKNFKSKATLLIHIDIGMDWNGNKSAWNDIQQCRLWVCILDFIYQGHPENDAKIDLSPWLFLHKTCLHAADQLMWLYEPRMRKKKLSSMNKWHWTDNQASLSSSRHCKTHCL
jgi:hypothetical protein